MICRTSVLISLLLGLCMPRAVCEETAPLVLENESLRVILDRHCGTFLRVEDKVSGVALEVPARAAENFRIALPVPGADDNRILGREQPLAQAEVNGNTARLFWKGPLRDTHGQPQDIDAEMTIALDGPGMTVRFTARNRTPHRIDEAAYPVLGGVLGLDGTGPHAKVSLNPPPLNAKACVRPFGEYAMGYPGLNMPFVDVQAGSHARSVYFGAHERLARYKLFRFQEAAFEGGSEVFLSLCHLPLTPPGGTFEGASVVLKFHDGDWVRGGKEIYRPWFVNTFGLKRKEDDWVRRQGFYQMIMIMLPEGNVNYRISEIPQLARDGLKYGVTSLQIAGWQRGGHDNGYPYYEPDPRLGTWEELRQAIEECHRLGVKVYFFANLNVVNVDTEWYKKELKDCAWQSANGGDYRVDGWGMGTLASRMGLTTPLMGFYDPSFPAMHDGHLKYFKKLAEIGADGLHLDKMFPGDMNFNPRIAMPSDTCLNEGALKLIKDIHDTCGAIHPGFALSHECNLDRVLTYGLSTWWAGNMSQARQVFPELLETIGLYQPYDYFTLNEAVRNGYAVMISPFHFNRSMDCKPWRGLAKYIGDVKKIRDELADIVFFGERIADTPALRVDMQPLPSGIAVQGYRSLSNGKVGCVVTNAGANAAEIRWSGSAARARIFVPGAAPKTVDLPCTVTVAPERLIMAAEE